jgi:hypothetical protein
MRSVLFVLALCLVHTAHAEGLTVSDPARRGQAPEVAVGPDGSVHVIWLDKGPVGTADRHGHDKSGGHSHQSFTDLMYARSDDGGRTFTEARRVNATNGEVWGFAVGKPRIGIGPTGIVHVFYPANATSTRTGKAVASSVYVRSTDGGRTFSAPVQMNADAETDLSELVHGGLSQAHVFGTMAVAPGGDVYTFWLDTRDMTAERTLSSIFARASHDDGATFAPERRLFTSDACPCCQLTAAPGADGAVYLGSRTVSPDNLRMPTVTVSRDRGEHFEPRVSTGGAPWTLEGCPLKPVAVAVSGEHVYTLVHNGAEQPPGVLFARSVDGGRSFEPAIRIHPEAAVSDSPALVSAWRGLYAFWHAKAGGERRIYMRTSTDQGASWSAVTEIEAPAGAASYPAAAAMPDGSAFVVWQQGEQIMAAKVWTPVTCKHCGSNGAS